MHNPKIGARIDRAWLTLLSTRASKYFLQLGTAKRVRCSLAMFRFLADAETACAALVNVEKPEP